MMPLMRRSARRLPSNLTPRTVLDLAFLALAAAVPFLPGLPGLPTSRIAEIVLVVLIYQILALGLNVVPGFTGLLDLGYVAFVVIGSYTTAILCALPGLRFDGAALLILLAAGLHCAAWGVVRGAPTVHLTGDYYAIVTFAFAEIAFLFVLNEDWLTAGPQGLKDYPPIRLFGRDLYEDTPGFYYLVLTLLLLTALAMARLRDSRLGRAWHAIKADELAAQACGIRVGAVKLSAFAVSAFCGGIGGGLLAFKNEIVSPNIYDFWLSIIILGCVVLGGMGGIRGPLLGTAILIGSSELLRQQIPLPGGGMLRVPDQARFLVFGLVLLIIMIFRPEGILPPRREFPAGAATPLDPQADPVPDATPLDFTARS